VTSKGALRGDCQVPDLRKKSSIKFNYINYFNEIKGVSIDPTAPFKIY